MIDAIQYCLNFIVLSSRWCCQKKNFRPIACCNTLHKCYSAILTNKLKKVIPEIISNTQSAFVKGRHILDNVLLMPEVVRGYHRKDGSPRAVIEIDIMKAYDTLNWDFLFAAMKVLGFPAKFIALLDKCVTMVT